VGPYGDVTTLPADAAVGGGGPRTATVRLDQHPRYIRGVDRWYALRAGVHFSVALTLLAPGESAPLTIEKHPLLANCRVDVQRVTCAPGLTWDADRGRLTLAPLERAPSGNLTLTANVRVRPADRSEVEPVTLDLHSEVEVLPELTLTVGRAVTADALRLTVGITSETERPTGGELRLVRGAAGAGAAEALARHVVEVLGARETRTEVLSVPLERVRRVAAAEDWFVEFGAVRQRIGLVPVVWSETGRPELRAAVDAAEGGWRAPALRIDRAEQLFYRAGAWSAEDASAEVRLEVGPEELYLRADVRDQDPVVNPHPPREIWRGDGLEVFLGVCGPTERTVIRRDCEVHLGLAPGHNTDGPPVAFWFGPDRVLTEARLAVRRLAGGYVLEAAIPLAEIGLRGEQFRPGTVLALDVTLNDLDRNEFVPVGDGRCRELDRPGTLRDRHRPAAASARNPSSGLSTASLEYDGVTTASAIASPLPDRVLSVDVFRALTILGMIFVNELGQGFLKDVPAWLRHAPADVSAMTVADLVFPAFLFIVGLAIPLALDRRRARGWPLHRVLRHIIGRTFGLLVLGVFMVNLHTLDPAATGLSRPVFELLLYAGVILVLNRCPDAHGWRRVLWLTARGLGVVVLVLLARQYRGTGPEGPVWLRTQWWGILGLIGWAYLVSSLAYLATRGAPAGLMGVLGLLVLLNIGDRCGALAALQPLREYVFLGGHIGGHASLTVAGMLVAVLMGLGGPGAGGGGGPERPAAAVWRRCPSWGWGWRRRVGCSSRCTASPRSRRRRRGACTAPRCARACSCCCSCSWTAGGGRRGPGRCNRWARTRCWRTSSLTSCTRCWRSRACGGWRSTSSWAGSRWRARSSSPRSWRD